MKPSSVPFLAAPTPQQNKSMMRCNALRAKRGEIYPQNRRENMDLKQHLIRQMAFSHATFGPGTRAEGIMDHLKKEIEEVKQALPEGAQVAASEWVDLVILSLDGLTRQLAYCNGERRDPDAVAEDACNMIVGKQTRNEARSWPDWRTADHRKAIEHIR
jgi:hypothetical protein